MVLQKFLESFPRAAGGSTQQGETCQYRPVSRPIHLALGDTNVGAGFIPARAGFCYRRVRVDLESALGKPHGFVIRYERRAGINPAPTKMKPKLPGRLQNKWCLLAAEHTTLGGHLTVLFRTCNSARCFSKRHYLSYLSGGSPLMRVDLAFDQDSRCDTGLNIGHEVRQRAAAIRKPSSGPAFHRAALPNVLIYPHKAGLPPPLKSPRHRSLALLEASP